MKGIKLKPDALQITPGSNAAHTMGCTCPSQSGAELQPTRFAADWNCPLHGGNVVFAEFLSPQTPGSDEMEAKSYDKLGPSQLVKSRIRLF